MFKKIQLLTLVLAITVSASTGFAFTLNTDNSCVSKKQNATFYFNGYEEDIVAQVNVIPGQKKMVVSFFDRNGYEVKLHNVKRISGQAILADGTKKNVIFTPQRSLHNKKQSRRASSTFIARAQWIKDADGFALIMNVPVEGNTIEMAYNYGCSAGERKDLAMIID